MSKKRVQRNDDVWNSVYQPFLNPRRTASSDTQAIAWMIERKLLELSMNRFTWEGLPDEIDVRWMEMSLNFYGLSVFHFDPEYDKYFAMRAAPGGQLNFVGNPTEYHVYGNQFYNKTLGIDKCVPIWANYMRMPDWDIIRIYSTRLAEMDRTIEINAQSARRSKIITASENQRLTAMNMNRMIDEGSAFIPVDTSFDPANAIQTFDLGINPDSIINMHMLRTREWGECMTMLGINVSNQDKKERLTAAETSGNDDVIATIRATNLQARERACDEINKMYPNLNVSVRYTTDEMDVETATLKDSGDQDGHATPVGSQANGRTGAA